MKERSKAREKGEYDILFLRRSYFSNAIQKRFFYNFQCNLIM